MREALAAASLWGKLRVLNDKMVLFRQQQQQEPALHRGRRLADVRAWMLKSSQWRGQFEFEINGAWTWDRAGLEAMIHAHVSPS